MRSAMPRAAALCVLVALLAGACGEAKSEVAPSSPAGPVLVGPPPAALAGRDGFRIDTVASGLDVPWALDFAPDGRVFLTERSGRIRVVQNGRLLPRPWAEFQVYANDPDFLPETGLLGVAVSPDFASTGHVFVTGTFRKPGRATTTGLRERLYWRAASWISPEAASPWEGRVYRLTDRGGRGVDPVLIVGGLPASHYHAGGALAFGPDRMLYLSVGDATHSDRAQDPGSAHGKVLRLRPDGGVPADNPAPGSPVFALGLRNVQALAWTPRGDLLAVEHGPTGMAHEGGRGGHDELNLLAAGANYGWPLAVGGEESGRQTRPIRVWHPGLAPAGIAVYDGPISRWAGSVFVAGLRGRQLIRIGLSLAEGRAPRVLEEELVLGPEYGRLRTLAMGPDGGLYFTTSNRDGRGTPSAGDDRLMRIVPVKP